MITQHNGLPVYKALVDDTEDTGMVVCSLVDEPAIERDFVAFDKQVPLKFKVEDEEKRMVLGPVIIPDMLIYRRDENNTEYYITYPAETIHKMAEKYFKNNYQNNVDTDHSFELVDGVVMTQAFFKNTEMGINPAGFEDLPDDTLFFQFHILSDDIWDEIKAGTWKGYSLAGTFNVVPMEMNKQKKSNKMSKLNKVREMLQSILATFERISTDKGLLSFDGDELEVGMSVMVVDEEGNESKPEDGEYKTDEGMVYVIADGKVSEIREEPTEDTTGDDVEPQDEIKEEMQKFSLMHRMAVAFESYLEKEDKIRAGLAEKGIDGWLMDAGDDFVVVGVWNEESMQDKMWRYTVSWDEDGNAIIGEGIEVKSAFVPVEEDIEKTPVEDETLAAEKDTKIAELQAQVDQLLAKVSELENKPAAEPAEQEFENITKTQKTGNKRMDNLSRIINA